MDHIKNKIIYQIWPRSFMDKNGDGIGDIAGIIEKLEYLSYLRIDYIWIVDIYPHSDMDTGGDITDYCAIDPILGTMKDFQQLIYEARRHNIKIILDISLNHVSARHPWFIQALQDSSSPYRDYFYFRDAKTGFLQKNKKRPPNNWMNVAGESAWVYDEHSGQYILSLFSNSLYDLNWENPSVRNSIYEIMEFWLKKEVGGFLLNHVNTIGKTPGLPDCGQHSRKMSFPYEHVVNLPISHEFLQEMHENVLAPFNCVTIGEGIYMTPDEASLYTSPNRQELLAMLQLDLHTMHCGPLGKYAMKRSEPVSIGTLKEITEQWQEETERQYGWPASQLSAHDLPRHLSLFGNEKEFRKSAAKAFALLNLSLRGTPILFQGEEIGMLNEIPWKKDWLNSTRCPFQWTADIYAGFSTNEPLYPPHSSFLQINVELDQKSDDSIIEAYRSLISLRKKHTVLVYGSYIPMHNAHRYIISYLRTYEDERILVMINLSAKTLALDLGDFFAQTSNGKMLYSTHKKEGLTQMVKFQEYEGFMFEL